MDITSLSQATRQQANHNAGCGEEHAEIVSGDKISPLSTPSSSPIPSTPKNAIVDLIGGLRVAASKCDRDEMLLLLSKNRTSLSCIPLPPPKPCTRAQAVKDLLRERIVLNGIRFLGQGSLFLETLQRLTRLLCSSTKVSGGMIGDATFITEAILTRCARTTSGADSYYTVDKMIGAETLLLKPRGGSGGELPPIDIELFSTGNSVQCAISSTNCYDFYKFTDIEMMGNRESMSSDGDGSFGMFSRPWLSVDTVVVEKIDFKTGRSLRFLRIEIPTEKRLTAVSDSPGR